MTILIFFILLFNSTSVAYASESQPIYARVMYDDVYLYKQPSQNEKDIYFSLPKTYFVKLIDNYDETFYIAEYKEFTGYVKKSEIKAVQEIPSVPYLQDHTFRVYAEKSQDLRTEPSSISGSSVVVANIPMLCDNLIYYGHVAGESKTQGRTNLWYYCKYQGEVDYYGYVYSDFCDKFSIEDIPLNTESLTYIANPTFEKLEKVYSTLPSKSDNLGIIVLILSFPALIFLYLILRNTKIFSHSEKHGEIQDY